MTNNTTTISKEEKARMAEEKRIAKRIEYVNGHFFATWFDADKNGKPIEKHAPLTGSYNLTENAVIFNSDMYNFTVAVDNLEGGVFLYSRCKTSEKSAQYYYNNKFAKDVRADSKDKMQNVLMNETLTMEYLITKAQRCKGFKATERKAVMEAIKYAKQRAKTVHNSHIKAAEKKQKEVEAKAV